ncbi:MAG: hypothetical protein E6J90_21490 [Deltaproteobacteria bacterium]|nr:MAG: hypothetical protein E6J90_21490 [Deltaproteobacteria bacterium]
MKQPSLRRATWPSGHAGAAVVQEITPRHMPAGSAPVMQVARASSHQAKPCFTASASLVQLQVATQLPFVVSHIDPCLHWVSNVQDGFGMQDDRAVSQWKPAPQSLSVPQKPPSVQMPFWQKQPAAHWASPLHWKPGGFPPEPLLPPPLPLEPLEPK